MNPTTHATEGSAAAPVLYMALELSNRSWRLAFGDGAKQRQISVPAADLAALAGRGALQVELTRFRGRFGAWVTSGYPQAARGAGDRGKCREM